MFKFKSLKNAHTFQFWCFRVLKQDQGDYFEFECSEFFRFVLIEKAFITLSIFSKFWRKVLNFYTRRFVLSKEKMNCFQAKKGLSDDAKDIQIKALQTGFETHVLQSAVRRTFVALCRFLIFDFPLEIMRWFLYIEIRVI